jgi:hypothetical protein
MNLSNLLLSFGGNSVYGDQIEHDPDCQELLEKGKIFAQKRAFIEMEMNECHWNISRLFEDNVIDKIVIGYALSKLGTWFQHTWGLREDTLVETTEVNFLYVETYFGIVLEDPKTFVELCKNNPAGSGKVRRKENGK